MVDTSRINLISLIEKFRDEETCREYLEKLRWSGEVACPRCGDMSVSEIRTRDQFDCNGCRYRFSVTSGTIFDNTNLPLWKWFVTIYLICESKKSISANQIKRTIGVTYKTAWHLCHRIRSAMRGNLSGGPTLFGVVEVDETLVGGKRRGVGTGNRVGKTWVAGAVQRGGEVRIEAVPNIKRATLHAFIARNTRPDTEAIYTDELKSYLGIADHDTRHETVRHSAEEWVVGDVHTNSVEGVWSLLKRSIVGAWHQVSAKHLDAYLSEVEFRINHRNDPYIFEAVLIRLLDGQALRYRELIAA